MNSDPNIHRATQSYRSGTRRILFSSRTLTSWTRLCHTWCAIIVVLSIYIRLLQYYLQSWNWMILSFRNTHRTVTFDCTTRNFRELAERGVSEMFLWRCPIYKLLLEQARSFRTIFNTPSETPHSRNTFAGEWMDMQQQKVQTSAACIGLTKLFGKNLGRTARGLDTKVKASERACHDVCVCVSQKSRSAFGYSTIQ